MEAARNPEEEEEAKAMASMRLASRSGRRSGSRLHRLSGSALALEVRC
jgi:hypothetical protein